MSLPSLRQLAAIRKLEDVKQLVIDLQANFALLGNAPRLVQSPASAGTIKFLAIDENGDWAEWSLVAGVGVTITLNSGTKTLTIKAP